MEKQSARVFEINLPAIATSVIGLEVINHMDIMMYDNSPELSIKFLECSLMHSPNLQCFEVKSINNPSNDICIDTDVKHFKSRGYDSIMSKCEKEKI